MNHSKRQLPLLALVLLLGSVLVACQPVPLAVNSSAPGISVGFSADSCPIIAVQAGWQVTWTNQDNQELIVRHRPEDAAPQFDSGILQPGDSFAFTFAEAGNYPYECSADAAVLGTVTVEP